MSTAAQVSKDRLALNFFIALPVLALAAVIRYYQKPQDARTSALTP